MRKRWTMRRIGVVTLAGLVLVFVGWVLLEPLRIPPQRNGADWRVISRPMHPEDWSNPSLTSLASEWSVLEVMIGAGECERVRIVDIQRQADVIDVSVERHTGIRIGGCDDIGVVHWFVIGLGPALGDGATSVRIDDLDPILLA